MQQTAATATPAYSESADEVPPTNSDREASGSQDSGSWNEFPGTVPVRGWAVIAAVPFSAVLLALSFPNFELWPLAWLALVPLLVVIARRPEVGRSFLCGWLLGGLFFYLTCYWLTYSMTRYGGIHTWLAYLLLIPLVLIPSLFPAMFALVLTRSLRRWGSGALLLAPFLWVASEWARLSVTGQLWNAIGYSQAFHPALIQAARFAGVYGVGFLIVAVNAAVAYAIVQRTKKAILTTTSIVGAVGLLLFATNFFQVISPPAAQLAATQVVALQPNVPMEPVKSASEIQELVSRHLLLSERALLELPDNARRMVIWPESPMNFSYGTDLQFRDLVERFAREHHTAVLFNSQEVAPHDGYYNSALLLNEEGRLIAQYDKIRLMPFGEYVPLPRWLPGSNQVRAIVGEFTPGTRYVLMPVGKTQAGVFICIESAYPWIARTFAAEGADVLINISNDGYLGPTAVMRQHLANAVFRAVENGRPLLRVTNAGITAYVGPNGKVSDATPGFQTAVRTWTISKSENAQTPYTRYGDLFAGACSALSLFIFVLTFRRSGKTKTN